MKCAGGLIGAVLMGLLAGPVAAKDEMAGFAALDACMATAMEDGFGAEACVGLAAAGCMEASEGGQTTVGMGACLVQELDWWQAGLDAMLAELMALNAAMDAENAAAGMTVPSLVDALDAFHRAWIAYRDAACTYEYAHWMGGTGGGPASAECHLHLTGAHMLELSSRLRDALIPEP